MISFHNIFSIAKYERKTLLRSWFFRIFSALSLFVLFFVNFAMVVQGIGPQSWAIRSIPSSIPYFNLLILNVVQAIIAVFLASDFLKRDKKLDTTEVIYMRSMSNSEYVLGKTWGNMQVFLLLNILIIALALVFNMLAKNTEIAWQSYVFYLFAISVPTIVFIMGLSFLLMSVIRNQAITFVLILGYIGITLFLLQSKFYYIFDYMAFNIPMLSSDIVGLGNLDVILIHRGIYLFLGSGFIFLTIFLLKRLPQSESMTIFSLIIGLIFIGIGSYLAYDHVNNFRQANSLRERVVALNNEYVNENIPTLKSNSITLNHKGKTIEVNSIIKIKNENETSLNKLIFNLNNGLEISSIKYNGSEQTFERKEHLILLSENININPSEEATLEFTYSGVINEALCYLDVDEETIQEKYGSFVLNVDKRYAFINSDYVLLTPETNWYVKAGVLYSSDNVKWVHNEFVEYDLTVNTAPGLTAVSQGEPTEISSGRFSFKNENPLTQISLAIGNYKQLKTINGNIEYGIWYIDGHDFFSGVFPETKDTIPYLANEFFSDFQRRYNLDYSFERLSLVEVPAQFKSYVRTWTSRQEYIQPEQILIPEKAFMLSQADFENSIKMMQRRGGGRGGGNLSPQDLQIRVFGNFANQFTSESSFSFNRSIGGASTVQNQYFLFPLIYNLQNNIKSDKWPVVNQVFEAYLKSKSADMQSFFMRGISDTGLSNDELANIELQDNSFEEIISDPDNKDIIENVIKLKGDALFSKIQYIAGEEEFSVFIDELLEEYRFKDISFEEFDKKIGEKFGINLTPVMDEWFKQNKLPGFLFSPVTAVQVRTGESMQTMIKFKATNFTDIEGLVKLTFRLGDGGGMGGFGGNEEVVNKLIHLDPHQTKDLSYMLESEPRLLMINTLTSQNVPQLLSHNFREIPEDIKVNPFEGEILSDVPVNMIQSGEIIVDNEDSLLFEITSNKRVSLLEKWIIDDEKDEAKYQSINNFRPPTSWTATTNTEFFGSNILSGYYIKSGDGSQTAKWNVPVKEEGFYEVYYHLYKASRRGRDNRSRGSYLFTITGDDDTVEQALDVDEAEPGWVLLGTYSFSPGRASIELSNKSELNMVFADAVKFIKQ
ncbi:MAG: hypothetical protein LBV47_03945 [Bacteroidales bacterium]|jgi:ABC-type transport system involved in multi-copper enzyme maturation permease subunit|nr:hypothetical protein [Bacteroidales bacterium]